nr:MAG TPA: hypothetical protein [Caudoviricetes sp.]
MGNHTSPNLKVAKWPLKMPKNGIYHPHPPSASNPSYPSSHNPITRIPTHPKPENSVQPSDT